MSKSHNYREPKVTNGNKSKESIVEGLDESKIFASH